MLWSTVLVDAKRQRRQAYARAGSRVPRGHNDGQERPCRPRGTGAALVHVFAGFMQGVAGYNLEDYTK
eukprot:7614747-Pyramimonas_sp.AAC.1